MYDDILSETLLAVCEGARQFDPQKASFKTWVVWKAKSVIRDMFYPNRMTGRYNTNVRYEYMSVERQVVFTDHDDPDNRHTMIEPHTYMTTAFDLDMPRPETVQFMDSLSSDEMTCLVALIANGWALSYRALGREMNVNHVRAGKVLKELREKAAFLQI
jgi:DNA-directed RNA polymerase specialized sigma24 family protein